MNLDNTLIPPELLGMIEKISDSDTLKYIFMIGEGKTVSTKNFGFVSQFPKNYLLPINSLKAIKKDLGSLSNYDQIQRFQKKAISTDKGRKKNIFVKENI